MDLYYVDESYDRRPHNGRPVRFVLSAVRVREDDWEEHHEALFAWRRKVQSSFGVPLGAELHATELLGRGGLAGTGRLDEGTRVSLFSEGVALLASMHHVHVINVSLTPTNRLLDLKALEAAAWDRLFNRINRTAQELDRRALLICDEGREQKLRGLYRQLRQANPVPSRYGKWGATGKRRMHLPLHHVVEEPLFRSSRGSYLLQVADLVAYSLLRFDNPTPKTERTGVSKVFPTLDPVLYRAASPRDPFGVVRR